METSRLSDTKRGVICLGVYQGKCKDPSCFHHFEHTCASIQTDCYCDNEPFTVFCVSYQGLENIDIPSMEYHFEFLKKKGKKP